MDDINRVISSDKGPKYNSRDILESVLESLPYVALVFSGDRKLIFANTKMLDYFDIHDIADIVDNKPGCAIRCVHSTEKPGGCGASDFCRHCGLSKIITSSFSSRHKFSGECRFSVVKGGSPAPMDVYVSCSPLKIEEQELMVVSLQDISGEKRRQILERVFFEDILDSAGNLASFAEYIKLCEDMTQVRKNLDLFVEISNTLVTQIKEQKDLIAAENGLLKVNYTLIESVPFMKTIAAQITRSAIFEERKIAFADDSVNFHFVSDPHIAANLLRNMMKNALEASVSGSTVICRTWFEDDEVLFSVHNDSLIPEDVKVHVFERSFSTKGDGHGFGTYAMKLFAEKYLGGKIFFSSLPEHGTTFQLSIPFKTELEDY